MKNPRGTFPYSLSLVTLSVLLYESLMAGG
jgi:hypothetical protein